VHLASSSHGIYALSIEIGAEYSTLLVEDVEIVVNSRPDQTPIVGIGAFGAGIEDRSSTAASALDGLEVVVFAHVSDGAPGNLVAVIEGFWIQCGQEAPISVVQRPFGEAWRAASVSLDDIVAATSGELAVGDVAIRVDQGDGWRLADTEPGLGQPHEVAIMTSEPGLDRAADARWFKTRPQVDFDDVVCGGCENAQIEVDLSADDRPSSKWPFGAEDRSTS